MWDTLQQVSPPIGSYVDFATVKAHLRVNPSNTLDDGLIAAYVASAAKAIDGPRGIGCAILPQQWTGALDRLTWPGFSIPFGPVQSVDAITYLDSNGNEQTVDPNVYRVVLSADPQRVVLKPNCVWPTTLSTEKAVTVLFTAGMVAVPADIQQAILLTVGSWYEQREGVVGLERTATPTEMPLGVESILSRYRLSGIA